MSQLNVDLKLKLAELEEALLSAHPNMPSLLATIHGQLKKDPEQVTLLSEEEIGIIVRGLSRHTSVAIMPAAKEKKVTAKSRLDAILKSSGVSAEDF